MVCKPAISSMSLGRAWVHDFPNKIDQAARAGFTGLEIFYEDLEYLAKSLPGGANNENRIAAAHTIRSLCDKRGITIIVLQPFLHYEGLKDRQRHAERVEDMKLWFQLCKILGTDVIQIPASFLTRDEITDDMDVIVADLTKIADMGAQQSPPINFAYESLAWSTYIDTWEKCWDIIEKVDRPNFGICLDTFNIAARVYADPAAVSGKNPNADQDMQASINRMLTTIDLKKIFLVQIVDGERLDAPLVEGHDFYVASQPKRMSYSRNCRLFYGETDRGAYLPVKEITDAFVHGLGFQGWLSFELFNRSMNDASPSVPEAHAARGMASWYKMVDELNLNPVADDAEPQLTASKPRPVTYSAKPTLTASEPRAISVL